MSSLTKRSLNSNNLGSISAHNFYSSNKRPKNGCRPKVEGGESSSFKQRVRRLHSLGNDENQSPPNESAQFYTNLYNKNSAFSPKLSPHECSLLTTPKSKSRNATKNVNSRQRNRKALNFPQLPLKQTPIEKYVKKQETAMNLDESIIENSPTKDGSQQTETQFVTPERRKNLEPFSCHNPSATPLRTRETQVEENETNIGTPKLSTRIVPSTSKSVLNFDANNDLEAEENKENLENSFNFNDAIDLNTLPKNEQVVENRAADDPLPLKNLGNTCYMNSIIQSLFVLTKFMDETENEFNTMKNGDYEKIEEKLQMTSTLLSLYSEYRKQKKLISLTDSERIKEQMKKLKNLVGEKCPQFKSSNQQDAVEFLELILNSVKEEFDEVRDIIIKNPVQTNFEIKFKNCAQCTKCGHQSSFPDVTNHVLYLCLPEKAENFTLQDAVDESVKTEKAECECNECGNKEKLKLTQISQLPAVLFLQLGRYSEDGTKRHEDVKVPNELHIMKMSTNVNVEESNAMEMASESYETVCFELVSAICHYGSTLCGGHYVSYVYQNENEKWYLCDDDAIIKSSLDGAQEGMKTSGCCFFYVIKSQL
ncbi:hypothetical protein B4U79_16404 [Dinothrombium tinctorium]|uniref:USP domain-containing protein n=1 Tax=Dinothrombium tinctorium TaxID=1965070 RepID=A0A3S3P7S4_9ACAR|nr:hypothetical protein B4U79_16110 [Dinothrombium tinctorium]RWS08153.1 hypothetical protein B4U79_17805 [Dinothrombium tinctorium]RWS16758.1 hypothetical protein B4U79_16404 [Dinothrombium tinctorium]